MLILSFLQSILDKFEKMLKSLVVNLIYFLKHIYRSLFFKYFPIPSEPIPKNSTKLALGKVAMSYVS